MQNRVTKFNKFNLNKNKKIKLVKVTKFDNLRKIKTKKYFYNFFSYKKLSKLHYKIFLLKNKQFLVNKKKLFDKKYFLFTYYYIHYFKNRKIRVHLVRKYLLNKKYFLFSKFIRIINLIFFKKSNLLRTSSNFRIPISKKINFNLFKYTFLKNLNFKYIVNKNIAFFRYFKKRKFRFFIFKKMEKKKLYFSAFWALQKKKKQWLFLDGEYIYSRILKNRFWKKKYKYIFNKEKLIIRQKNDFRSKSKKIKKLILRNRNLKKKNRIYENKWSVVLTNSRSNYFLTLIDTFTGKVILSLTSGKLDFVSTQEKRSILAFNYLIEKLCLFLTKELIKFIGYFKFIINFNINRLRLGKAHIYSINNKFRAAGIRISRLCIILKRPHNLGIRKPKLRRK